MKFNFEGPVKGNWQFVPWLLVGVMRYHGITSIHFGFLFWFLDIEL